MPEYKGADLDPARGPGLGCFWFQAIVLGVFLLLIPIGISLNWAYELLAALLIVVLVLLLFVGQTLIFLLRLVAADRRTTGRRRPLASSTRTVGEIEDAQGAPALRTVAELEAERSERAAHDSAGATPGVSIEPGPVAQRRRTVAPAGASPVASAEQGSEGPHPAPPATLPDDDPLPDAPGPDDPAGPGRPGMRQ